MAPERPTPDKSRNGSLVAGPAAVPAGGGVSWNGRELGGTFALGPRRVRRAGYGAMQLAGDGVFGPPRDRDGALRVVRGGGGGGRWDEGGPPGSRTSCTGGSRTISPPSAPAGWRR